MMKKSFIRSIYQYTEKKLYLSLAVTFIFIIFAAICSTFLPVVLKKIVDQLAHDHMFGGVKWLLALYSLIMVVERLFNEMQFIVYSKWENGVINNAFVKLFSSLFYKNPKFYVTNLHGTVSSRIYQGVAGLDALMFDVVFKVVPAVIGIAFIMLSLTVVFDCKMSLIVGMGAILYTVSMSFFNKKLILQHNSIRNSYNDASGVTTDLLNAWKDIKLTNAYHFASNLQNCAIKNIIAKTNIFLKKRGLYGFLQSLPICLIFIITNYYAISRFTFGIATIGSILMINNYLFQILRPLESFSLLFRAITKSYSDYMALDKLLDQDQENVSAVHQPSLFSCISLENLCINEKFSNINMSIRAGEKIAIIGASGSGKTSLINVLVGLGQEYEGNIFINGERVNNADENNLRSDIAYLSSDARLMNATIQENIAFDKSSDIFAVLRSAYIAEKVNSLEYGIHTTVNENSPYFSSGEKQRLKIARTLFMNKPIEIFDESTSALDKDLEKHIIDHLLMRESKTVIFITHKMDYLHRFDKVYKIINETLEEWHYADEIARA